VSSLPAHSALAAAVAATIAGAAALAGCGLGAGATPSSVQLLITRDFGASVVRQREAPALKGEETAMSLLRRNDAVTTRFGGGFVQGIDGISGGQEGGEPVDWFYYVNGVQASRGAAETKVNRGDHIWWDRHDWSQTERVPAVVGSFPEPFLHGIEGKRLPVRVDCAQVTGYACRTVAASLRRRGVPAAIAGVGISGAPQTLRVLVGPWISIRRDLGAQTIAAGPRSSGVYARFSGDGHTLTVLDERGRTRHALLAGAGLVAATRNAAEAPVWVVTGTDSAGVDLAARALDSAVLRNRFAVALSPAGTLAVPEAAR
jgi:hypothetical protein